MSLAEVGKKISPVDLTNRLLSRIERLQPTLNAFITVTSELAMEQAQKAEREIDAGNWRGLLHGMPVAVNLG